MSWKGSSNIDGGFVIDLRGMNQIDISVEDQTVKLGPGSLWQEVYKVMTPYNVSTAGGRINAVGVGGFLLGGGSLCTHTTVVLSSLTPMYRWDSLRVCRYRFRWR